MLKLPRDSSGTISILLKKFDKIPRLCYAGPVTIE